MTGTARSDFWLNCARAGMELCWLSAWVNYFALIISGASYPWHNALVAFGSAALAAWLAGRGRRRVYQVALIHMVFLAVALLWGLHGYYGQGAALWDFSWIRSMADRAGQSNGALLLWAGIAFSLLFWFSGRGWYRRKRDYEATSRCFDWGLAGLLGLFVFKLLLRIRFEVLYPDPFAPALFIGFFCFALPALAWSRSRNRTDLVGCIGGGLWRSSLGLLITLVLLAGGAVSFYLPYLNQVAQTSYVVLQKVLGPLAPYLIAVLKFIFKPRSASQPQTAMGGGSEGMPQDVKAGEMPLWVEIIFYVVGGLFCLIAAGILAALVGLALRRLYFWLLSPTGREQSRPSLWRELGELLRRVWSWVVRRILGFDPNLPEAVLGYYRLKKWGRRSGLVLGAGETPREYGDRLVRDFPRLAGEVGAIVEAHEQAVYAQHSGRLLGLRRHLRRLASPLRWPRRLKTRWRSSRRA